MRKPREWRRSPSTHADEGDDTADLVVRGEVEDDPPAGASESPVRAEARDDDRVEHVGNAIAGLGRDAEHARPGPRQRSLTSTAWSCRIGAGKEVDLAPYGDDLRGRSSSPGRVGEHLAPRCPARRRRRGARPRRPRSDRRPLRSRSRRGRAYCDEVTSSSPSRAPATTRSALIVMPLPLELHRVEDLLASRARRRRR